MKWLVKICGGLVNLVFLAVALGVITAVAYFFGNDYLLNLSILGNDSAIALTYIAWLDRFWPKVPLWYPLHGGGISFVKGYSILADFLVVWLSRLAGINIFQAFRWVFFASVPLAAIGLHFLGWRLFKSQVAGLMAAVMFLLSPITWTWLFQWGFFGFAVSIVFFPWACFFFDFFLQSKGRGRGFWLLATEAFFILTTLTHVLTGMVLAVTFVFQAFLTQKPKKALADLVTVGGLFLVLAAFWLLPFYRYMTLANREGLLDLNPEIMEESMKVNWDVLLAMEGITINHPHFVYRNIALAPAVWLAAAGGIVLSIFRKKARPWGALAVLAFVWTVWYGPFELVNKVSPILGNFYTPRSAWIHLQLVAPLLAGYGLWSVFELPVSLLRRFKATAGKVIYWFLALTILPLFSFWLGAELIIRLADKLESPNYMVYGGERGGRRLNQIWESPINDICAFGDPKPEACRSRILHKYFLVNELLANCEEETEQPGSFCWQVAHGLPTDEAVRAAAAGCRQEGKEKWCVALTPSLAEQLAWKNWPWPIKVPATGVDDRLTENEIVKVLPEEAGLRLDTSPQLGGLAKTLNIYTDYAQVNAYTYQLSLFHSMWGYYQGAAFSRTLGSPRAVADLARWLGVRYILVQRDVDPVEKYSPEYWEKVAESDGGGQAWRLKEQEELVSWEEKPTVLMVGQFEKRPYELVFRLANEGMMPYERYFLVEGKENGRIDDYTAEGLAQFEMIVLHGYQYDDQERTWGKLAKYLEQGGRVWVETGWQYAAQDWQLEEAPACLPMKSLGWEKYDPKGSFKLEGVIGQGAVEVGKFTPLEWEGEAWGVSGGGRDQVRDWAKVILSYEDQPVVVGGNWGKGKIVWSGMNVFAHAYDKKNEEEVKFLGLAFDWLAEGLPRKELKASFSREYPDRVEINLEEGASGKTTVYWREAYHPDWRAKRVGVNGEQQKLKVYRGGPGMVLVRLGEVQKGEKVILEFKPGWPDVTAKWISILGGLGFAFWLTDKVVLGGKLTKGLGKKFGWEKLRGRLVFSDWKKGVKSWWESDKDEEG